MNRFETTHIQARWRGAMFAVAAAALVFPASGANAAATPTAVTGEAIAVTTSAATLKGTVYPAGQQTSYYFQYGPTTSYGTQTSPTSIGGGTQTLHVTVVITGLASGATYHYRVIAVTPTATIDGQDRTFAVKKVPLSYSIPSLHFKRLYESPFTVNGTLSGTEGAHHTVVLQANPFPYLGGFKTIGSSQTTDATGGFSFAVPGLAQNTQLRVATLDHSPAYSHVIVALVAVKVSLHVASTGRPGTVRLFGAVAPAEPGAWVGFQLLRPGRAPMAIGGTLTKHAGLSLSRFSRIVHIPRRGLYRAVVNVVSGAQISNHSRPLLIG